MEYLVEVFRFINEFSITNLILVTVAVISLVVSVINARSASRSADAAEESLQKKNLELTELTKTLSRPQSPLFSKKVIRVGDTVKVKLTNKGEPAKILRPDCGFLLPKNVDTVMNMNQDHVDYQDSFEILFSMKSVRKADSHPKAWIIRIVFQPIGSDTTFHQLVNLFENGEGYITAPTMYNGNKFAR